MRHRFWVVSLAPLAILGCLPARVERGGVAGRAPRLGAQDERCRPRQLALSEFAGLEAGRGVSQALSLASVPGFAESPRAWEFQRDSRFIHYTLHADPAFSGRPPEGFQVWFSGRDASEGFWGAERPLAFEGVPGTDAVINLFEQGQLHGFISFPRPVNAVRVRIASRFEAFVRSVEVAAQHSSGTTTLSLDGGSFLPPGFERSPKGFTIVPRSSWGAASVRESGLDRTEPAWIVAHHSSTPIDSPDECAAHVLSYQRSHITSRGWLDIGYHFLVCPDGRVFEGRATGKGVQGAHALHGNQRTVGISFIGNYQTGTTARTQTPDALLLDTGARLVAWLAAEYGVDLNDGGSAPPEMRAGTTLSRLSWHNKIGELNATRSYGTDCAGDLIIEKIDEMRLKAMEYVREYGAAVAARPEPTWAPASQMPASSARPVVVASGDDPCPQY